MLEQPLIQNLGIIFLAGTAVSLLAHAVRVPTIVAYIVAGLLLGPALGMVEFTPTMELISEAGIILLLFLVGLELSVGKIREVGRIAVGTAIVQMLATALALGGAAVVFGATPQDAAFLGVALTFSSTVVVVKLLDQQRELDSRYGRVAVGVLLVQDLAVILVLKFVGGVGAEGSPDAAEVARDVALAFAGMGLLLAAVALTAWRALPRLLGALARSQAALLVGSLAWCFVVVSGAELLELSPELGAFVAGVALAQLPYSHELRRRVHPLMNFFVAVFFVSLGAQMQFGAAVRAWPLVVALSAITLFLKPTLVAWTLLRFGESKANATQAGIALGQASEFSYILAGLALTNGLIDDNVLGIIGVVGLVTMGASTILAPRGHRLLIWMDRRASSTGTLDEPRRVGAIAQERGPPAILGGGDTDAAPSRSEHIVVVGMNSLGRRIVELLCKNGEPVLAVDNDLEKLRGLPCPVLFGNTEYMSVLEEAGIRGAKLLVSALHIEEANRLLAYRASQLGIPSVFHASDPSAEQELQVLGVAHVLNAREASVARVTEELREVGIFG